LYVKYTGIEHHACAGAQDLARRWPVQLAVCGFEAQDSNQTAGYESFSHSAAQHGSIKAAAIQGCHAGLP